MFSNQKFMIVLDLDGTLLSEEKTILKNTGDYLRKLNKEGHIIALASGRPLRAMMPYYNMLHLDVPVIAFNGTQIYSPSQGKLLFEKRFPKEAVMDFLNTFPVDMFVNLEAECGNKLYFLKEESVYENYFHKDGMDIRYGEFKDVLEEDCNSFLIELKEFKDRKRCADKCFDYDDIGMRYWYGADNIGEFYFYSVNKASAMQKLQMIYGIDRAHTIAFGDAENDIQMLHAAGISFCMKNGSENLKKVAQHVTREDNDHDGIYLELKEIFG